MKRIIRLLIMIGFFIFIEISNILAQDTETITFLTSYPSPYGRYSELSAPMFRDRDVTARETYILDPNATSNFYSMEIFGDNEITNTLTLTYADTSGIENPNIFLRLYSSSNQDISYIQTDGCDLVLDPRGISTASPVNISPSLGFGNGALTLSYANSMARFTLNVANELRIDVPNRTEAGVEKSGIVEIDGDWLEVEPTINEHNKMARVYAEGDEEGAIYGKATVRDADSNVLAGVIGKNISGGVGIYGEGSSNSHGAFGILKRSATDVSITNEAPRTMLIGFQYDTRGAGVCGKSYVENIEVEGRDIPEQARGVVGKARQGEHNAYGVKAISRNGTGLYVTGNPNAAFFYGCAYPSRDNEYDLGSDNLKWRNLYVEAASLPVQRGDLAEVYITGENVEPGDVVVIDEKGGILKLCDKENDQCIIGVVSEDPVITIGSNTPNGKKIAILGQVYAKVDATRYPIETGDLLTTSSIPGHAMKAVDPKPGTVLGKALQPLEKGRGKILILIN